MPKHVINGQEPEGDLWTHEELLRAMSIRASPSCKTVEEYMKEGIVMPRWLHERFGHSIDHFRRKLNRMLEEGSAERVDIRVVDAAGRNLPYTAYRLLPQVS